MLRSPFARLSGKSPSLAALVLAISTGAFLAVVYASFRLTLRVLAWHLNHRNDTRRRILLAQLDIREHARRRQLVGYFHPYCNAGGGGERVLWAAIAYMQRTESEVVNVVYTGDKDATKEEILTKVKARFAIDLDPASIAFVFLMKRGLVEETAWPRFTLLGQSLGSMILGYEALSRLVPDIFIDTMGYSFALNVVKSLTDVPAGAYVHYPTISSQMVQRVQERARGHTNTGLIASSAVLSAVKLFYYIIFTELYSLSLRQADYVMVNSSWTYDHIQRLLQPISHRDDELPPRLHVTPPSTNSTPTKPTLSLTEARNRRAGREEEPTQLDSTPQSDYREAHIVYPPCDCSALAHLPLELRETLILSIAQFRPEKEHLQQLRALRAYLDLPDHRNDIRLVMVGSVRNAGDEARVASLRLTANELGLEPHVSFLVNAPFSELLTLYVRASIGLSTMIDEHFGINVVEMMAAGLIPIVHASGGPLLDIVVAEDLGPTGFHATTSNEYALCIAQALELSSEQQVAVRQRARQRALQRFDTEAFEQGWSRAWRELSSLVHR